MTQEKLSSIYARDPMECLREFVARNPLPFDLEPEVKAFLWTSALGARSPTVYGSFKTISLNDLKNRQFLIFLADYRPSIFWIDHVHNERVEAYYGEGPKSNAWPLSKASYDVHAEIEKQKALALHSQRTILEASSKRHLPF